MKKNVSLLQNDIFLKGFIGIYTGYMLEVISIKLSIPYTFYFDWTNFLKIKFTQLYRYGPLKNNCLKIVCKIRLK